VALVPSGDAGEDADEVFSRTHVQAELHVDASAFVSSRPTERYWGDSQGSVALDALLAAFAGLASRPAAVVAVTLSVQLNRAVPADSALELIFAPPTGAVYAKRIAFLPGPLRAFALDAPAPAIDVTLTRRVFAETLRVLKRWGSERIQLAGVLHWVRSSDLVARPSLEPCVRFGYVAPAPAPAEETIAALSVTLCRPPTVAGTDWRVDTGMVPLEFTSKYLPALAAAGAVAGARARLRLRVHAAGYLSTRLTLAAGTHLSFVLPACTEATMPAAPGPKPVNRRLVF